jgi:hypothetical protein
VIGAELEQLLRRLVREELARARDPGLNLGQGPDVDDDAELRALAVERASKLRRSKGER